MKSYTKKEQRKITRYINKWIKKFSLGDWEINWCIADCQDECVTEKLRGQCVYLWYAKKATIYISPFTYWPEIKSTIRHELLHLVFAEYREICCKYMPEDLKTNFESAEHGVINRLNPLL